MLGLEISLSQGVVVSGKLTLKLELGATAVGHRAGRVEFSLLELAFVDGLLYFYQAPALFAFIDIYGELCNRGDHALRIAVAKGSLLWVYTSLHTLV